MPERMGHNVCISMGIMSGETGLGASTGQKYKYLKN